MNVKILKQTTKNLNNFFLKIMVNKLILVIVIGTKPIVKVFNINITFLISILNTISILYIIKAFNII
jgi:hypothetical protein